MRYAFVEAAGVYVAGGTCSVVRIEAIRVAVIGAVAIVVGPLNELAGRIVVFGFRYVR